MRKAVLITGIGGDISQGVATILRECRPDLKLIGVDVHVEHGGHLYVDYFQIVPPASDPSYLDSIRTVAVENNVDVVIPMSEPELEVLQPFEELAPGISWIFSGQNVIKIGLDKLETARALARLGLPVPWTVPVENGALNYPCILKNRRGSGSRAIFIVNDDYDAAYLVSRYPEAVFQELLLPVEREITCAVYRNRESEVAILLMQRRLTGGFTGWARVIKDTATEKMCQRIAEGLDLRGCMNIQLRLTDKGPRVFEINPRFSSTVLMRHRLGFTDVLWSLEEYEGKRIHFPLLPPNQILVRVQEAKIYTSSNQEDK